MDLVSTVTFPADPEVVFSMLTDPGFQDSVAERTHCVRHEFELRGSQVRTLRVVESPAKVAVVVGPTLSLNEVVDWQAPGADGGRRGTFVITVEGIPVLWKGTTSLLPRAEASVLTYEGELTVSIPIIGKSLERQAADAMASLASAQESVASSYLAR